MHIRTFGNSFCRQSGTFLQLDPSFSLSLSLVRIQPCIANQSKSNNKYQIANCQIHHWVYFAFIHNLYCAAWGGGPAHTARATVAAMGPGQDRLGCGQTKILDKASTKAY